MRGCAAPPTRCLSFFLCWCVSATNAPFTSAVSTPFGTLAASVAASTCWLRQHPPFCGESLRQTHRFRSLYKCAAAACFCWCVSATEELLPQAVSNPFVTLSAAVDAATAAAAAARTEAAAAAAQAVQTARAKADVSKGPAAGTAEAVATAAAADAKAGAAATATAAAAAAAARQAARLRTALERFQVCAHARKDRSTLVSERLTCSCLDR